MAVSNLTSLAVAPVAFIYGDHERYEKGEIFLYNPQGADNPLPVEKLKERLKGVKVLVALTTLPTQAAEVFAKELGFEPIKGEPSEPLDRPVALIKVRNLMTAKAYLNQVDVKAYRDKEGLYIVELTFKGDIDNQTLKLPFLIERTNANPDNSSDSNAAEDKEEKVKPKEPTEEEQAEKKVKEQEKELEQKEQKVMPIRLYSVEASLLAFWPTSAVCLLAGEIAGSGPYTYLGVRLTDFERVAIESLDRAYKKLCGQKEFAVFGRPLSVLYDTGIGYHFLAKIFDRQGLIIPPISEKFVKNFLKESALLNCETPPQPLIDGSYSKWWLLFLEELVIFAVKWLTLYQQALKEKNYDTVKEYANDAQLLAILCDTVFSLPDNDEEEAEKLQQIGDIIINSKILTYKALKETLESLRIETFALSQLLPKYISFKTAKLKEGLKKYLMSAQDGNQKLNTVRQTQTEELLSLWGIYPSAAATKFSDYAAALSGNFKGKFLLPLPIMRIILEKIFEKWKILGQEKRKELLKKADHNIFNVPFILGQEVLKELPLSGDHRQKLQEELEKYHYFFRDTPFMTRKITPYNLKKSF